MKCIQQATTVFKFDTSQSMKKSNSQAFDDQNRHSLTNDVAASVAFLTRLPVAIEYIRPNIATAVRGFAIVGLIVGLFSGVTFWLATSFGLSANIAGFLAIAVSFLITGGLHEDGLADVCDGFGGGWSRDRKLEIMRDSSIGTYGTFALIISTALRGLGFGAIVGNEASLIETVLIFASVGGLSRIPIVYMMYQLTPSRPDGRAVEAGRPSRQNMRQALLIGAGTGFLFLLLSVGFSPAVLAIFASLSAYFVVKKICLAQIGGYTGDVLGMLQQISEIFIILLLVAII